MENQFDLSFDWDGTLTSGDGPIGQDNGAVIDVTPLRIALSKRLRVAVMTCNEPWYVAARLQGQGIAGIADTSMQHKTPPPWLESQMVMVTNRKVLSRVYVDDRNIAWRFGDDPELIFEGM